MKYSRHARGGNPLSKPMNHAAPLFWEHLNMKFRMGTLLFDMLLDSTFVPGRLVTEIEKHNHFAFEIQFILSGAGTLFVHDSEQAIYPNTIHLIGPHIFHCLKSRRDAPITRMSLRFTFKEQFPLDPWFPHKEIEQIKAALSNVSYCQFADSETTAVIRGLMDRIRMEILNEPAAMFANVHSLFAQLIVQLVRSIRTLTDTTGTSSLPGKTNDEMRFRMIDHFFTHYKQHLTIEMLANRLNLSEKQVNRLLQQYYGTSFKQKLLDTRVEVAKDLLRKGDIPIQLIAEEVGYGALQNFNRIFKQKTGMNPSQYRSRMKSRPL